MPQESSFSPLRYIFSRFSNTNAASTTSSSKGTSSPSDKSLKAPQKSSLELESVYNMLLERIDEMENALKAQICLLATKKQALQEQGRHLKTRLGKFLFLHYLTTAFNEMSF